MDTVRVRMAPSPTGFFHIGNAKTALYNWLFARKSGGTFILRLEDTDVERSHEGYSEIVGEALQWLGLDWDEGPDFAGVPARGDYGPYRQSQRKDLYLQEANRLVAEGTAYKCYCTKEELDAERAQAEAEGRQWRYSGRWRDATPDQVAAMGDAPFAIRFKVPGGVTAVRDLLLGTVRVDNREIDDFIVVRANREPMFHLAVVVDDGLMKISHVIRGDDHLSNAPKHVMLFEALGYPMPAFVHHPLIHDEHGRKYSKRLHGANLLDWREDGYLPETMVNYLALLGWTPEEENRELFTPGELVQAFSLDWLGLSAGKFDLKKVQWLNGQHIRRLPPEDLRERVVPILERAELDTSSKSPALLTQMAAICQEKIPTLNDIVGQTDFFFREPTEYEEKAVKKQWRNADALERMRAIRETVASVDPWNHDEIKAAYEVLVQQSGQGLGKLVHPTRLALTGKSVGPGLFELAELLGKDDTLKRMDRAMSFIETMGDHEPCQT